MRPIILYRDTDYSFAEDELKPMQRYFPTTNSRMDIRPNDLVIGRYSVLPYYRELEHDLKMAGAKLINSYSQHSYIANLTQWATDLSDLTPQTWTRLEDIPEQGPFVLKGQTNSKKFAWNSSMFAVDKAAAIRVYLKLQEDELICRQNIYIRKYVPLVKLGEGVNGLPISEEFRLFVLNGKVLTGGFYWSSHSEDLREQGKLPSVDSIPGAFLEKVLARIGDQAPFVVIDVAKTVSGEFIVVELNDGQMSGLSDVDPDVLYRNMNEALKEDVK